MTDYIHSVFSFLEMHCLNLKLFYCHHPVEWLDPRGLWCMFRDVTLLLQTGGYLVKRFINWKEKENATNPTRRQLSACGRWSHGKWEETEEPKTRSPQSLWGCYRSAQEGVPKPAGSLIMAAAPGGRQKARFLCTEAGSGVGTILCSSVIPPYAATGRSPSASLEATVGSSRWESSPVGCCGGGPRLPESFLPNSLAPHLWKEARASAVPRPERKPSQQAGIPFT